MLLCTVAGLCEWRAMGMWALPQVGSTALGVQISSVRESMSGLLFRPVCVDKPGVQAAQLDGGGRAQVAHSLGLPIGAMVTGLFPSWCHSLVSVRLSCLTVGMGHAQVAQSLGLLIGATVLDAKVAQTVAAVIMLTMMLARPPASLYTGSSGVCMLWRRELCQLPLTFGLLLFGYASGFDNIRVWLQHLCLDDA